MSAECRRELGETSQSLEDYEELIKKYPKSEYVTEAKKRVQELKK